MIQGPPGSGKTWTSGRLIADLIARGNRVGVASTSHKAIHNLLAAVEEAAAETGLGFKGLKKASGGNPESFYEGASVENVTASEDCVDCDLAAGTAWLFSNERHDGALDYLFVDEAGQVSLADALAMGTAARNLVLVGDPLQLDQVLQGTHPGGSDASVLEAPARRRRDRPARPRPLPRAHVPAPSGHLPLHLGRVLRGAARAGAGGCGADDAVRTGLRYLAVEHEGHRQESAAEVAAVRGVVAELRAAGVTDVIVVAPYNAQVNALREALPGVRVGTVDKFQGQEAAVVIYSMASSSGEDVPRGLDFLLSRNRLNVAISRARCLAYLVCSPRLLEAHAGRSSRCDW